MMWWRLSIISQILMNIMEIAVTNVVKGAQFPVEALSWDITLGTAGTGLGQLILQKTSSSFDLVPEAIDHVGIVVYGYLYEYGDLGILKNPVPQGRSPKSKYPVFKIRDKHVVGTTRKKQKEFDNWVNLMNRSEFKGSAYNLVTKSCVNWGIQACKFLGVKPPDNWEKICLWAEKNKKVTSVVGIVGVEGRKVQLKVASAPLTKRVLDYAKTKLEKHNIQLRRKNSNNSKSMNKEHRVQ